MKKLDYFKSLSLELSFSQSFYILNPSQINELCINRYLDDCEHQMKRFSFTSVFEVVPVHAWCVKGNIDSKGCEQVIYLFNYFQEWIAFSFANCDFESAWTRFKYYISHIQSILSGLKRLNPKFTLEDLELNVDGSLTLNDLAKK